LTTSVRLPASERRQAILETAIDVFAAGSYRGCTTAEIARAAGVSEPILYRHFGSKRELYQAALDNLWDRVHEGWERAIAAEPDPKRWLGAITQAHLTLSRKTVLAELWVQALSEAGEDDELKTHLRRHMREVHAFVADVIRRSQAAGGIVADRDPDAEAWIFIAGGVLGTLGRRVGLLGENDFAKIKASRVEWMTGSK
jgi:AcrR family transcriptional regulator